MTLAMPRMDRLPATERGLTIADFLVPIRVGERLSSTRRHIALVIAGAIVVALAAQVSIPLPGTPVPITGQTFGVLLVGGALGFRRGALALLLYLVAGFALPVYAGHESGIGTLATSAGGHIVLGSKGGYLLGFVLAAALVGRLAELGWDRRVPGALAALFIGNVLVYAIGVPWLAVSTGNDVGWAVAHGVMPFVLTDALKLLLAAGLFPVAWWVVGRSPGER
ncbi:MAG TPA: biotin transporter BioY [Candidatus Limnocylindrales bacterium]|nr:biotin transporter BioY [Candidatus Limnocylindrales bacterium]